MSGARQGGGDAAVKLLVVGLNPAWQKTLWIPHFAYGEVNRAEWVEAMASGKGINAARAARASGARPLVLQFVGGNTGEQLCADLDREGLDCLAVPVAGPTRTCTTLLDPTTQAMTELIEPAAEVTAAELQALRRHLPPPGEFQGVAICGTCPPGVPTDFYAEVVASGRPHAILLLDACREIDRALAACPTVLKINAGELHQLTGCGEDLAAGIRQARRRWRLPVVAVTAGPAAAWLGTDQGIEALRLPTHPDIVSPLGAGDTTAGVLLARLCQAAAAGQLPKPPWEKPLDSAQHAVVGVCFAHALAAASASCLTARPAVFDLEVADRIRARIQIVGG